MIMSMMGTIPQAKLPILKIYAFNNPSSKYIKQNLREPSGDINKSMLIFEKFNSSLQVINRTSLKSARI